MNYLPDKCVTIASWFFVWFALMPASSPLPSVCRSSSSGGGGGGGRLSAADLRPKSSRIRKLRKWYYLLCREALKFNSKYMSRITAKILLTFS